MKVTVCDEAVIDEERKFNWDLPYMCDLQLDVVELFNVFHLKRISLMANNWQSYRRPKGPPKFHAPKQHFTYGSSIHTRISTPASLTPQVRVHFDGPAPSAHYGFNEKVAPPLFNRYGPIPKRGRNLKRPHSEWTNTHRPSNNMTRNNSDSGSHVSDNEPQVNQNRSSAEPPPKQETQHASVRSLPQVSINRSLMTFEAQAQDLISQIELSNESKRKVQIALSDLTQTVQEIIFDAQPIVFGSMCSGLALETSDIDAFLHSERYPDGQRRIKWLMKNRDVFSRSRKFHNIRVIPKARVPLMKATHTSTGIDVDVSCTSTLAVANTHLIKYLVHNDDRTRPLILMISYYYRLHKIVGMNRFTNYSVILLVAYYLQKVEPPVIPPLCKLLFAEGSAQTSRSCEKVVWPSKFQRNIEFILGNTENQMSLAELFLGYFRFYSKFNFANTVISPYLGSELESSIFSSPDSIPDELDFLKTYYRQEVPTDTPLSRNFLNAQVCVQDPIEHHMNKTKCVSVKTFKLFCTLNQELHSKIENMPENEWLDAMLKVQITPTKPHNVVSNKDVIIKFAYSCNNGESVGNCDGTFRLMNDLCSVFELLLFTYTEMDTTQGAKMAKREGDENTQTLTTFFVKTHFNVFTKRFKGLISVPFSDPSSLPDVKKKIMQIRDGMKKPEASFEAELIVERPQSPNEIWILCKDMNPKPQNTFSYIVNQLQKHLEKLLISVNAWTELQKGNPSPS